MTNYIIRDGELYHYGVKGMKWGVRKERERSGIRYGSKSSTATTPTNGRDHSKSNKSELAIWGINSLIHLATLNPVGLVGDSARLISAGKSYVKSKIYEGERGKCTIDKKTGLLRKNKEMSMEEDLARVNPNVRNFDSNTKNNCMLCTAAYDLRRRGYEVQAKKASYGYTASDIQAWYPKAKVNRISSASTKDMIASVKNELVKQGNGARGNLMISWKGSFGGHSVAYEVKNNQLQIVDAQVNKIYTNPDKFLRRCANSVQYARLDNVPFNPKNIKEVAG